MRPRTPRAHSTGKSLRSLFGGRSRSPRRLVPWAERVEDRVLLSEFRVNTYTANDQSFQRTAVDGDGDFVIAWTSEGQDGSGAGVYAQRYNAAGVPQGDEFRVNTYTAGDQNLTGIASDAAGNFVVVWESYNQAAGNSGYDIYARTFDASGLPRSSVFQVNNYIANDQTFGRVAMDAQGQMLITWTSEGQDGSAKGVYGRRFTPLGVPIGPEIRLNTYTAGDQSWGEVAAGSDRNFIVTWTSFGQDGSDMGVYGQRIGPTGLMGPEFRVNTFTAGAQQNSAVAADAAGNFVFTWMSDGQDGSENGVYARRYSADGTPRGGEFRVNSFTAGNQFSPYVLSDAAGNFVVSWISSGQTGDLDVYAQRYDASGAARGGEFRVNSFTAGNQRRVEGGMDADGNFVLAWVSVGQDGSGHGIYAARYPTVWARAGAPVVSRVYAGEEGAAEYVAPGATLIRSDLTRFALSFSENLNASTVTDAANWSLTRNGQPVNGAVSGVTFGFNAASNQYEAVANLSAPLGKGDFVLQVSPAVRDLDNNALDGDYDGTAGGAFRFAFTVDPITVGPEFRISGDPSARETDPGTDPRGTAIARDAQGNFMVVWAAFGSDGSDYGVRARRYNAAGVPLGAEFTVNTYTAGSQGDGTLGGATYTGPPKVAMNPAGNAVVAWTSFGQDGSSYGIYAQRFNAAGQKVGGEFRVNTTTGGAQVAPAVSMNDSGSFAVVWQGPDGSNGYDIFAQVYNPDGSKFGTEFRVNVYTANWQNVPSVFLSNTGELGVVWNSFGQDGSGNGIYGRRFSSSGPLTGDVRVNATTAGEQNTFHSESIAIDAAGNFVVVWNSDGQDGSGTGIYAQRYNAAGQRLGGEFQVNTRTFADQYRPSVAMSRGGDFVITWNSDRHDGSGLGAYAQRYNAAGVPQGGEFRVNTSTFRNQESPTAVIDDDGNMVVVWVSAHEFGPNGRGVFGQRFGNAAAAADILVGPTDGLVTTESGGTATFSVRLATQPTANVTVGIASSDTTEGTVSTSSLTFTTANWNVPQTVTVTGVDDPEDDGDVAYTIVTAAAVSADPAYNGKNAPDVSVVNTNNDTAGITVTPTSGLVTTEGGGTANFVVRLNSRPTANVTIGLSSSNPAEGTVGVPGLTFTPANWSVPQTVTVTGVNDDVEDGAAAYTIVTAAASADPKYNGINPADVSVVNADDDAAGITVAPTSGLVTTESGGTATFTVRLNSKPVADVTVGVSSSDPTEGAVSVSSLTFTPADWNSPRTVTVTGLNDATVDGDVAYTIVIAPAVSNDPAYSNLDGDDVSVVNADNDSRRTPLDFDGDGRADPAVFRIPSAEWFYRPSASGGGAALNPFGAPGLSLDVPLSADFDGDGKSDQAVFRVPTAQWFYRSSATGQGVELSPFGAGGLSMDLPIAADFDGDGKADQAVFRFTTAQWIYRSSATGQVVGLSPFGAAGLTLDVPLAADFDGDGKADPAVFRVPTAQWFYRSSVTGQSVALNPFGAGGLSMDLPIAADFDGDGKADQAVFRSTTAQWFYRSSATGGGVGLNSFGAAGLALDVPVGVTPAFWRFRRNAPATGGISLASASASLKTAPPVIVVPIEAESAPLEWQKSPRRAARSRAEATLALALDAVRAEGPRGRA